MATRTITSCDRCKRDAPVAEATITLMVDRASAADLTHVAVWWESNINKKMDLCKDCFETLRARMEGFLEADFDAIGAARDRIEALENTGMSTVDALRTVHQEIAAKRTG